MAVLRHKAATIAMVLSLAATSACTCPQAGAGRTGHATNGQDPSGGSLAFFGSLRSMFAPAAADENGCRSCNEGDLESEAATTSATTAGAKAGEASLSIR